MSGEKPHVYTDAEIPAKLAEHGLTGWYLEDGWLRRKYTTDGWPTTLMLVNAIGYLCEAAWHHADLAVTWGKVWVKLKTHSAGATRCARRSPRQGQRSARRSSAPAALRRPMRAGRCRGRRTRLCIARRDSNTKGTSRCCQALRWSARPVRSAKSCGRC